MEEKIFKSIKNVKYRFIPVKGSNRLVVGFSAISKPNTFYFNYVHTLDDIPVNRLYIMDNFGEQGSYYLGENKDFSIETSVISLILHHASILDIPIKNITTIGSSKGGFSAIYFAIKYSLGEVLALAPQTLLGNFLKQSYPNVLSYITGGETAEEVKHLNELLFNVASEDRQSLPEIYLMVGSMDSHRTRHMEPFIKHLDTKGIPYNYDLIEGVNHSELKDFAPEYIRNFFKEKYLLKA